jgi:hypothetical protein
VRITFITGSLEPGKDGVGDYARQLAGACRRLGHSCRLLAFNDRHIEHTQEAERSLRLAASTHWPERTRLARQWLASWQPDWISLQFVSYGFHPKGIVGEVVPHLTSLFEDRAVHLMLHELWIGAEQGASWRHRLTGNLQRRGILSLIQRTRPNAIQTTNAAYVGLLARRGVRAGLLPLCGNIPVASEFDSCWLERELIAHGTPEEHAVSRARSWRFGIFGSLHPGWHYEPLLSQIGQAASSAARQVIIASIGRSGPDRSLWQNLQRRYGERFSLVALGERTSDEVSAFLQSVDFGIALTPWELIGKSGSAAAMADHGLPVIVAGRDVSYGSAAATSPSSLFYRLGPDFDRWLSRARRQSPSSRLQSMATQFLSELECAPCLIPQRTCSNASPERASIETPSRMDSTSSAI